MPSSCQWNIVSSFLLPSFSARGTDIEAYPRRHDQGTVLGLLSLKKLTGQLTSRSILLLRGYGERAARFLLEMHRRARGNRHIAAGEIFT